MEPHDEIRDLLTLAASGALDAAEQRRVEDHVRLCADCGEELRIWQQLTTALEELPGPAAPTGMVERTQLQMERYAESRAEHRQKRHLLIWLMAFGWISTLLTWPLFQLFGGGIAGLLDLSWTSTGLTQLWLGYFLVAWMTGVTATALLSKKRQMEVSTL